MKDKSHKATQPYQIFTYRVIIEPDEKSTDSLIAVHSGRDIPKGTLHGILRDIEVSPKEIEKLL